MDELEGRLSDPEVCAFLFYSILVSLFAVQSGLVPTLLATLTRHARLAQDALDASVKRRNLVYLHRLKQEYDNLSTLANQGRLQEAVCAASGLESELKDAPEPLTRSSVMVELRVRSPQTAGL